MTVLELFAYIVLAIFVQIGVFAVIGLLRHWATYLSLKRRIEDLGGDLAGGLAGELASKPKPGQIEAPGALSALSAPASGAPWTGFRNFQVASKIFEDESHSVCSFHAVPVDGKPIPGFNPGQFLTFKFDIADPSTGKPTSIVRCYSLSCSPGLDHYRICVKRVLPPGLASTHLLDSVQEGDVLAVRAPGGQFFLEPGSGPVVLVAGGIGITPMLSMLDATLTNENSRQIWLFYGVRNGSEHIMKKHLQSLARTHPNFHLHVCYSRPRPEDVLGSDYQHEGHADVKLLRLTLPLAPYQFHVCGPRAMMEALVPALRAWGVLEHNINYEAFGPASVPGVPSERPEEPGADAETLTITFERSGKSLAWDGQDGCLLELAERHGIRIDSGCRAGACGSCQTAIKDGEVTYDQAPDFEPEPGHCLLCISRPVGDLSLLA